MVVPAGIRRIFVMEQEVSLSSIPVTSTNTRQILQVDQAGGMGLWQDDAAASDGSQWFDTLIPGMGYMIVTKEQVVIPSAFDITNFRNPAAALNADGTTSGGMRAIPYRPPVGARFVDFKQLAIQTEGKTNLTAAYIQRVTTNRNNGMPLSITFENAPFNGQKYKYEWSDGILHWGFEAEEGDIIEIWI